MSKKSPQHKESLYSYSQSVKTTKWKGNGNDILLAYLYLLSKHYLIFPHEYIPQNEKDMMWKLVISWRCYHKGENFKLSFPMGEKDYFTFFQNQITRYSQGDKINKNKVLFFGNGIFLGDKSCNIQRGHFNMLLIAVHFNNHNNFIKKIIVERFEPYGSGYDDKSLKNNFDSRLKKTFGKYGFKIQMKSPLKFMSKKSFQAIEEYDELPAGIGKEKSSDPFGFCGVWATFLVNLRLTYPEINTRDLIKKAEELFIDKKILHDFARNLSNHYLKRGKQALSIYGTNGFDLNTYSLEMKAEHLLDHGIPNNNKSLSHKLTEQLVSGKFSKKSQKKKKNQKKKKSQKKKKNALVGLSNSTSSFNSSKTISLDRGEIISRLFHLTKKITCQDIFQKTDIEFEGEGVANKVFSSCLDLDCSQKVAFRLMPYLNKYKNDKTHPVNVEIRLYKEFNKLNRKNKLPHTPLLLNNFKCHYSNILQEESVVSEYEDRSSGGEISPNINVMILEYCQGRSIKDFIEKYKTNLPYIKSSLFQIVLTLIVLQHYLPEFRHNDLHSSNVMEGLYNFEGEEEYRKSYRKNKYYICYELLGSKFYIPYLGFCMKIIDFDVSCAKKYKNNKVSRDPIYLENGVVCEKNTKFDLHLILNSISHIYLTESMWNKLTGNKTSTLHRKFEAFIKSIIPNRLIGFNNTYLGYARIKDSKSIPDDLQTDPKEILKHHFFEEYQELPPGATIIQTYFTGVN